jgi:integrase
VDHLKSARDVRSYFTRDLIPKLGAMKISDVTRADIRELVRAKADAPRAAAVLLMQTKKFFAWCADTDLIRDDPAASIKLRNIASVPRAQPRARVLDDAEIRALWTVESCGMHRLTSLVLKLIVLTGQRPGEVAGMHWDEIDGPTWTIPAGRRGKTGDAHTVPLTPLALELLEQARAEVDRLAKRRSFAPTGHVFQTGPQGALTIYGIDRAVSRYRQQLGNRDVPGLGHWRAHDLRRTCRTGLSACGIAEEISERVIGHAHKGIVAVYNQHRYDTEKRAALEAWERRLLAIINGTDLTANVLRLRR